MSAFVNGPVILVGHSIGGMINLTFSRRHPELLGSKVRGIVEMNSTYTNPTSTHCDADLTLCPSATPPGLGKRAPLWARLQAAPGILGHPDLGVAIT